MCCKDCCEEVLVVTGAARTVTSRAARDAVKIPAAVTVGRRTADCAVSASACIAGCRDSASPGEDVLDGARFLLTRMDR